jgi:hypothetical protein
MTIDERIEKLAERHEALTQTVEIIASMQQANEQLISKVAVQLSKLGDVVGEILDIVKQHERRLGNLEQ